MWLLSPDPYRVLNFCVFLKTGFSTHFLRLDRVYAVGFAGTRRLSDDITEEKGAVNRRVEVHMMPFAPPGRL